MIFLIGGATHTGKTLLSLRLSKVSGIPCTSVDHIKMGIYRGYGYEKCGYKPTDGDERIAEKLWNVEKGIIDTASENGQHIILEGCYFPPREIAKLTTEVVSIYIILSEEYLERHYSSVFSHACDAERRGDDVPTLDLLRAENRRIESECVRYGCEFCKIKEDYEREINVLLEKLSDVAKKCK